MKTHNNTINPICMGVSFFRAIITFYLNKLIANIQKRDSLKDKIEDLWSKQQKKTFNFSDFHP